MTDTIEQVIERLEAMARCEHDDLSIAAEAADHIRALLAKRDRLRKALEFYANEKNWENDAIDIGVGNEPIPESSDVHCDYGRCARAALTPRPTKEG